MPSDGCGQFERLRELNQGRAQEHGRKGQPTQAERCDKEFCSIDKDDCSGDHQRKQKRQYPVRFIDSEGERADALHDEPHRRDG